MAASGLSLFLSSLLFSLCSLCLSFLLSCIYCLLISINLLLKKKKKKKTHQSATEVDAESDTPPGNLHEDQSAREVDAESNNPPENLHEDWNKLHPQGPLQE